MKKRFSRFAVIKKVGPIKQIITKRWLQATLVGLVATVLLLVNLTSLAPLSNRENSNGLRSATLGQIKADILFAPTKALQIAALKFTDNDAWIRLASAAVAAVSAILLFLVLRKWFTNRISLLTSAMFITSSWFLHTGRLASHDALYLAVIPTLLLCCLMFLSKNNAKRLPLVAAMLAVILYIPGVWLLLLAGIIYFRKFIFKVVGTMSVVNRLVCSAIFGGLLAPLAYSFYVNHSQIITWLGYDRMQQLAPQTLLDNLIYLIGGLLWRGPSDGAIWLYGTPVLDIFSGVMLGLGIYAFWAGYYPARKRLILGLGVLCGLLIILGGLATISLVLPLLYIIIANGLAYMLQSWFTVFPRNPVARSLGVTLLSIVVLLSCAFNMYRYYVAWPAADDTASALDQARAPHD